MDNQKTGDEKAGTGLEQKKDERHKSRIVFYGIVMIVVSIFVYMISFPIFEERRLKKRARQKACIANIKMLENAFEMYDMDTPPGLEAPESQTTVLCPSGKKESATIYGRILQTGGYTCRLPKCPTKNAFTAYSVQRKGKRHGYEMYVSCIIHGTISMPKK